MQAEELSPRPLSPKAVLKEFRTLRSVGRLLLRPRARIARVANGEPVMALPGFGAGDTSMLNIRNHLRRAGFRTYGWRLGLNRGNVPALLPDVIKRLERIADHEGEPVNLVGWSLGGYLAREAAREHPDLVNHVVTLGSPIKGGPKYTATALFYERQGFDLDEIESKLKARDRIPLTVPVTCVFSKQDGIVDWRAVRDDRTGGVTNIEVDCSHMAMGFDPHVVQIVVKQLTGAVYSPRA